MTVGQPESQFELPPSLFDILSNSLILENTLPYLSLSAIFSLARTSSALRDLLLTSPSVFRYIDLSRCRGAYVPPNLTQRIDHGGNSWRADRIDENLTEDEFYSGPLRGVFANLRRMKVLQNVHTFILDDLASVTVDLLNELVTSPEYNVRFLSIHRCLNVNQSKLQQLLCHICRPTRPEGTPRLQGLYVFTPPVLPDRDLEYHHAFHYNFDTMGVTGSEGAQLGARPNNTASARDNEPWYTTNGHVIAQGHAHRSSWEETLQTCRGIISFDAVLCSHMHKDMAHVLHTASQEYLNANKPGIPPMATVALGPSGCASCRRAPHGAPVWGQSNIREFPLLWPPPHTGKLIDAVRPPPRTAEDGQSASQRLIVSCTWCLINRHCDSCHRWWCADCYDPQRSRRLEILESLKRAGPGSSGITVGDMGLITEINEETDNGRRYKVFNGLCVENCLVAEWIYGAGGGGMWG